MDNLDDSENNAKISDSAYSTSCSNSQSRRSRSSKSTHSGSNSSGSGSGSSGYGGKPSTSGSSNVLDQPSKKDKESKKKKQSKSEVKAVHESAVAECRPPDPIPLTETKEETNNVTEAPTMVVCPVVEQTVEDMEISPSDHGSVKDEVMDTTVQAVSVNYVSSARLPSPPNGSDGFSCVISMHDGVVMYTTSTLTTTLGFPTDMWVGRSFIDFVHPRDRDTFASQITNGLAVPKIVNGTKEKAQNPDDTTSTMVCRIRRHRGLISSFGIKDRVVSFMPFLLKFTFKNVNDDEGKLIYLVMQATPFYSAFKIPNEVMTKATPFVMRHNANGHIEYIESESVPYLGYMPQDVKDTNALKLFHPEDLPYLRQIYETVVKEGSVAKSRSYRLMVQNGDYVNLETEWSSFINPWSLKLEFVIGKHHVLRGPNNPDVFQPPETENGHKMSEEEKNKAEGLRESIVRIMNEVLTKPAETAKQHMNKRCQDVALFMERLIEDQPKIEDELRIEIQEPDYSYYERDSVMLGGISPHHDYNDSKSSTETPLSYNQLNYNETLQRYFDSHQPYCYEDYNTVDGENVLGLNKNVQVLGSNSVSPMGRRLGDSTELTSSCDSSCVLTIDTIPPVAPARNYTKIRLTESLLKKHNAEMEKDLVKMARDTRCSSKGERKKASDETRQKKKAHLARCNATFQPTLPVATTSIDVQPHGVKRTSKSVDSQISTHKHHCASSRQLRQRQPTSIAPAHPSSTLTTTVANCNWQPNPVNNMNAYILGVGIPQQLSLMNSMSAMPGVFPMYYTPAATTVPLTSAPIAEPSCSSSFAQPAMQCMMYGQAMYGQPFMYSPLSQPLPQASYPLQQSLMAQSMQYTNTLNPLGLTSNNYEQACNSSQPPEGTKSLAAAWRDHKRGNSLTASSKMHQDSGESSNALQRSTEAVPDTSAINKSKPTTCEDNIVDRTDGESSYSSFYSSFFKTESGSADDSGGDRNKTNLGNKIWGSPLPQHRPKKVARRKMEPPWMEQVCVTSQLVYKYQIRTKTMDEVLLSDKEKITTLEQPCLVNEQLAQLYLDMQLQGVATRLTLEEGITSSSSSGEETSARSVKSTRRKREYSKLTMIYEEDAPLPPPEVVPESSPSPSTSFPPS